MNTDAPDLIETAIEDGLLARSEVPMVQAMMDAHGAKTFCAFLIARKKLWVEWEIRRQLGIRMVMDVVG